MCGFVYTGRIEGKCRGQRTVGIGTSHVDDKEQLVKVV